MQDSVSSQNIVLRYSDDSSLSDDEIHKSLIHDTGNNNAKDVIVISDSSFTSTSKSFNSQKRRLNTPNYTGTINSNINSKKSPTEIYILETSDTDSEDERYFHAWKLKNNHKSELHTKTNVNQNIASRQNSIYTSDETSMNSDKKNISDNTHISLTPHIAEYAQKGSSSKSSEKYTKYHKTNIFSNLLSTRSTSTSSSDSNYYNKEHERESHKNSTNNCKGLKNRLTKQETRNILKNIKSTRALYESPREKKIPNVITDESSQEDIHPAISPKERQDIIDETPSDFNNENDIIENSQVDASNPHKTHISRFLRESEDKAYIPLSERKKIEISKWITSNSPCSSDISCILPSNRDSTSSGNSSLERLEMNYETPNNRGKISKTNTSESRNNICNSSKRVNSVLSGQITLDRYIQKSKENDCTPDRPIIKHPPKTDNQQTPIATLENIDVTDCVDILDKLYGNIWRNRADALLTASELKKQPIATKSRAVQTEKPWCTTMKKHHIKYRKKGDSFINDESSDGGSDSIYHTALTNFRQSTDIAPPKPTPISVLKRVVTICDSDTDDSNEINNINSNKTLGRRLSFSSDEEESRADDEQENQNSDTSEFDPDDIVPPKPIFKKGISRQISKPNDKFSGHKSFLASLSDAVPLSHAHPDAKKYRLDYKKHKEELCKYLYKLYNENVFNKQLPEDMSIEWNVRMRGTAGFCYNKKSIRSLAGIVKSSRIVLATKILDTPDRLRDTLIHEMCHAAAWLINDVSDGHGPFWTQWANKAMRTYPELPPIRRCHDYKIKTKFTYRCTGCGYSIGRHSKSLDVERKRCGHCYGKFELLINKTTKSGTVQMQTPKREPSGFALYVKENYGTIKKERNMTHAEIMKTLGQQFSAIKIAKKNTYDVPDDEATDTAN